MITLLATPPSGEGAKAGPWWFVVILLLCVASYFLYRSMSKHLRKVRDGFPTDEKSESERRPPTDRPSLTKPAERPAPNASQDHPHPDVEPPPE